MGARDELMTCSKATLPCRSTCRPQGDASLREQLGLGAGGATDFARIAQWHERGNDVPSNGTLTDATDLIELVVDTVLERIYSDR